MIHDAHGVADPRAVVIHLHDAPPRDAVVVRPARLVVVVALAAPPDAPPPPQPPPDAVPLRHDGVLTVHVL